MLLAVAWVSIRPGPAIVCALTIAVLLGAMSQAVTGFGFALVSAPVFVLALGASSGVRLGNMFSCMVSLIGVLSVRKVLDTKASGTLIAPALLVTPFAAMLARRLDRDVVMVAAGSITVLTVLVLWRGVRVAALHGRAGLVGAAATSATMNVLSGLSGPPIALYSVNAGWDPDYLRRVSQPYFLVLNLAAVASLGPVRLPLPVAVLMVGAGLVGFAGGRRLAPRLDPQLVRNAVLLVAGGGGLAAVIRGVF